MASGNSAERIKILRVIGRLNVGGPAIHVVNLTAGLDARRYRSLLVAESGNEAEGSTLDFAYSHGVMSLGFDLNPFLDCRLKTMGKSKIIDVDASTGMLNTFLNLPESESIEVMMC